MSKKNKADSPPESEQEAVPEVVVNDFDDIFERIKPENPSTLYYAPVVDESSLTPQNLFAKHYSFSRRKKGVSVTPLAEDVGMMLRTCIGHLVRQSFEDPSCYYIWSGSIWEKGTVAHVRDLASKVREALQSELSYVRYLWNYRETRDDAPGAAEDAKNSLRDAYRSRYGLPGGVDVDKSIESEIGATSKTVAALKGTLSGALTRMMPKEHIIKAETLDSNVDIIIFDKMQWDARTNEFEPACSKGMPTKRIGVEYQVPDDAARKALQAQLDLYGLSKETWTFIQRSLGYSMLGRATEKRIWWFRGEPDTLKSTILSLVLQSVGTYGYSPPAEMWTDADKSTSHTDNLARTQGCRWLWSDEFDEHARFKNSLVKKNTSGTGEMNVSFKGKTGFTMPQRGAIWCSSNFDAYVGNDPALLNRITAITFTHPYPREKQNPQFVAEFMSAGLNRFAILEWLMEGAREYIQYGLKDVKEVIESRKSYAESEVSIDKQLNVLLRWTGSDKEISVSSIRAALVEYQTKHDEKVFSKGQALTNALKRVFRNNDLVFRPSNGDSYIKGLVLIDTVAAYVLQNKREWNKANRDEKNALKEDAEELIKIKYPQPKSPI